MGNGATALVAVICCFLVANYMIGFVYALNFEQKIADENVRHYNFTLMCFTWLLYDMAVNHFEAPNY